MAVLGIQRLFSAQLVCHFAAMAASSVASVEIGIVVVDLVWCSMLPLVQFSLSISFVAIVTVGSVGRCSLASHDFRDRVEVNMIQPWKGSGCCGFEVSCGGWVNCCWYCSSKFGECKCHVSIH